MRSRSLLILIAALLALGIWTVFIFTLGRGVEGFVQGHECKWRLFLLSEQVRYVSEASEDAVRLERYEQFAQPYLDTMGGGGALEFLNILEKSAGNLNLGPVAQNDFVGQ